MSNIEDRLSTELAQLADALLDQHQGGRHAPVAEPDLNSWTDVGLVHRTRWSKPLVAAAGALVLAGLGYLVVDASRTDDVVLAQGGVEEPAGGELACPDFDRTELTNLSFAGVESGVLIGAWSTEAERFVGLCADAVEAALDAAGIDFTTRNESGVLETERNENDSITVRLVSDGRLVVAASID